MADHIYVFEVNGGKVTVDGKPQWPDCLTLRMTPKQALSLIKELVLQLESDGDGEEVNIVQFGILAEETE